MNLCIRCEKPRQNDAFFCIYCGSPQYDDCPHCGQEIPLNTTQCMHCRRFLRQCPVCHKLAKLDAVQCDNTYSECIKTSLVDFYQGFSMRGANISRTHSIIETTVRDPVFLDKTNVKTNAVQTAWTYNDMGRISEVVSNYGRVFFASYQQRRIHSIMETATIRGLSPQNPEVIKSDTLDLEPGGLIRNLTVASGVITFLAGPHLQSRGSALDYPMSSAYCLEADTLAPRLQAKRGFFQMQFVAHGLWLLVRYDREHRCSHLDVYHLKNGSPAFALSLAGGTIINDAVPCVATETAIFFTTQDGVLWRLESGKQSLEPVQWFQAAQPQMISAMTYGNQRLRVLACDQATRQVFHVYSLNTAEPGGLQKSPVLIDGIPKQMLWLLGEYLFIFHPEADHYALRGYDVGDEVFYPGPSRTDFTANDEVQNLLITQVLERRYVFAQIKRPEGMIHFRLYPLTASTPSGASPPYIQLVRKDWEAPGFLYSNGRIFVYDAQTGNIDAIKAFVP